MNHLYIVLLLFVSCNLYADDSPELLVLQDIYDVTRGVYILLALILGALFFIIIRQKLGVENVSLSIDFIMFFECVGIR